MIPKIGDLSLCFAPQHPLRCWVQNTSGFQKNKFTPIACMIASSGWKGWTHWFGGVRGVAASSPTRKATPPANRKPTKTTNSAGRAQSGQGKTGTRSARGKQGKQENDGDLATAEPAPHTAQPKPQKKPKGSTKLHILPFKQAVLVAHSLKLKNRDAWRVWCKSDVVSPESIGLVANPDSHYHEAGWQGWTHWLGGTKSPFMPFAKALKFARRLGLKSQGEWNTWCKTNARPKDIPEAPQKVYQDIGWQGYAHFLDVHRLTTDYLPYVEAYKIVHLLELNSEDEWEAYCKSGDKPTNIPFEPQLTYADAGWQDFDAWLGTASRMPFPEAIRTIHALKFKDAKEWETWCHSGKRPINMPSDPASAYKGAGWQDMAVWLGLKPSAVASDGSVEGFLPFADALAAVRPLQLTNQTEWRALGRSGKRPKGVPAQPGQVYKNDGWKGYDHWLGTGNHEQFLPFEEALQVAQSFKMRTKVEWEAWCGRGERPSDIPSNPDQVYRITGWQGYGHWLGTGNINTGTKQRSFLPFKDALKFARALKLVTREDWNAFSKGGKRPSGIPSRPDQVYHENGWQGYRHWLGPAVGEENDQEIEDGSDARDDDDEDKEMEDGSGEGDDNAGAESGSASADDQQEEDGSADAFDEEQELDRNIDSPLADAKSLDEMVMPEGAPGSNEPAFLAFSNSVQFVRTLNLKTQEEWEAWCDSGERPFNIPSQPGKQRLHYTLLLACYCYPCL